MWAIKLWGVVETRTFSEAYPEDDGRVSLKLPFPTLDVWSTNYAESMSARDVRLNDLNYYGLPWVMGIIFVAVLVAIIVLWRTGYIHVQLFGNVTNKSTAAYLMRLTSCFT